ncbi:bifunctional phosphopantothenoylcysteine decarboxylase/phosphopantothenate--cysteine ligase CoaBC [Synechococcus sp. Tobar12-5m-g]|uniref:bifunctional phosphopantothenoylcysteine decarboxylase/phosphopantothenate--cysteine ligase CoaBC n=1 Tax=unclassified Synechococcus TaxID=2626047 RepID=UPI0020CCD803|nr:MULTISPECIES: bifunctional phosphopantothenoylcysteine decarboxylase/phosphopantothenate--cysteine ligase CoaBC [unclassified Synechococcus]MCP9772009.1 bifunctional phosphopantothenoylcysteine decarboxylase/phosphopantothenate--cysteine ligase CoaBC [Synechococcus sp. Tobar12-5m-g]MCP9872951.1 bifunctional phosphopantothenoylcysteine decarboxylase/phosphopantothenate--cysteine ligase CoaBC [Synechococcus sp. Cruz CV-v-12]
MRNEAAPLPDSFTGRRVLVGISGSIAAVKLPLVVSALAKRGAQVRCVVTPSAARLVSPVALASLSRQPCFLDADQWSHQAPRPLHIELAEWAELVLVAPLSATSLGRWVHGLADTLLASTLLACEAPVLAAAAMNTAMWRAAPVQGNWERLLAMEGVLPLLPETGLLACDRLGEGRMADPALLLLGLESLLLWGWRRDWQGRRLLVTAGPTQEFLDPARCLTNPSSGLMGVLLAQAARLRGARVDLIHGPLRLDPALLEGLQCHAVQSADQLQQALRRLQAEVDAIAMAAAVADHRPAAPQIHKGDKQTLLAGLEGGWQEVPDLLVELAAHRPAGQRLLGFAAQSGQVLPQASAKFARKGCDLLFANPIDRPGAGFGAPTNRGWLLGPGECQEEIAPLSKLALAHRLLTALAALLEPPNAEALGASPPGC